MLSMKKNMPDFASAVAETVPKSVDQINMLIGQFSKDPLEIDWV